ncbi:hypothetical protein MBLNU230_g6431t1 [Neophaeotheca triangularis]
MFAMTKLYDFGIWEALFQASIATACFLTGLYSSLLIYRTFLNPLNQFPGPWLARIATPYFTTKLLNSDRCHVLQKMHKQYGPIVRIGSGDLSVADADFMAPTFGPSSKVIKSVWYDAAHPAHSLQTERSAKKHAQRRRLWAPAFSDRAIRDYEVKISALNDKIIDRVSRSADSGEPLDVSLFFNLWSFDVMARLTFGKNYGMLDEGKKHRALALLSKSMLLLAYQLPLWSVRVLRQIPGAAADYFKFIKFCKDELTWRVKNSDAVDKEGGSDIMSWLLKSHEDVKQPEDDPSLLLDTQLLIVAGSDTSATALTFLFFHLAKDPEQVTKLREELRPLVQGGNWGDKDIRFAAHLNGCINEALRLHPPVPSGVSRETPKEGLRVGDTFIPGHTTYITPTYVMGRDEKYYTKANDFVPERWYSKSEMIKHKDAFAPFSAGPMGCIGKNLALTELRTLTTKLLLQFDVRLADGEDGERLLHKTLDQFTVDCGGLDLVFSKI